MLSSMLKVILMKLSMTMINDPIDLATSVDIFVILDENDKTSNKIP